MQGAVIDEKAVAGLPVVSQAFTMVASDDQQGRVIDIQFFQFVNDLADVMIRVGDFIVVSMLS